MKKKLTRNLGMKILSLVLATILWLVVVNIDDPPITKTFRDVPVEIINESAISSKGKVYEVTEGKTVDVSVKGKRSVIDSLNKSDIKAVADLKNLIFTYSVPISVSCTKSSSVEVALAGDVQTLKVELEDTDAKQFKITIVPKGDPETGYSVGTIQAKPNIIQVSGAKSQIAKIDQVRVDIDVSNAKNKLKTTAVPKAYDAKGRQLDSDKLSFSTDSIALTAEFLKTKTVSLDITAIGEPMQGYEITQIDYEPKEITIAGNALVLKKIDSIPIKIDAGNATSNIETEVNITDWIPEKVKLTEESATVMVNILIEKRQVRAIPVSTDEIELKNLPEGMQFSYNSTNSLNITIEGLLENLSGVTAAMLKPYIDLNGLSAGTHIVTVNLSEVANVKVQENLKISITLVDKTAVDTEPGTDTAEPVAPEEDGTEMPPDDDTGGDGTDQPAAGTAEEDS